MHLKPLTLKQTLNKAYLKEKIGRDDIELFKTTFTDLLNKIDNKGDEEHLKSLVSDFLKLTWYNKAGFQINPKGKTDLIIHNGKLPSDPAGVLLEVKSPSNTTEMISEAKPNGKALHEIVLYYFTERITNNKHDVKHLVVTNINEWYIFDANEFDKKIYRNTAIRKLFEQKKNDGKDNPWFYEELKKLFATSELSLEATFFDIGKYKKQVLDQNSENDKELIPLFKILSPVHLLKLPFANDSNSLQPKFYTELLHIIGLYEYKDGGKKLISRKKPGDRNGGSLLENAIIYLDSHDKITRLDKASQYGVTYEDKLYNVALELVITWVNRILFLKLLEAQLLNYHKKDKAYTFLNKEKIKDFDDLDKLFFRVLAKKPDERAHDVTQLFGKVPYLNSSLFEPTELEHQAMFINSLENSVVLPVISSTVLKDGGKTRKGNLNTLDYVFDFLNAYDFSSEGAEEIQEENKTLINASVLGLIFEKINGYKDGSFFTPGFITMYMCRETIRRAVVQKFNDAKSWDIKEYNDLHNHIDNSNRKEANTIINSLKICDPAVGSGHFLVSALNEIIAIKSDLNVLMSEDGRTLNNYTIEVVNDELVITDENNDPFKYHYKDHRSQTVQKTLFHEKQTIIENCLFGVDINSNSVKICRLRLWIELLKNAYYKPTASGEPELETLPNIDINIKTGNSLISRHPLDVDLKQALKGSNWNVSDYRIAVGAYKNASDKEAKRELVTLIDKIKSNFRTYISRNSKEYKELSKVRGQLDKLLSTNEDLFGVKKNKKDLALEQRRLEMLVENKEQAIEDIKTNKIYENAFEWRFEFPEVLSDDGDFLGFDVVIGNPPYIKEYEDKDAFDGVRELSVYQGKMDLWYLFGQLGTTILKRNYYLCFIATNNWVTNSGALRFRNFLLENIQIISLTDFGSHMIFENASIQTMVMLFKKSIHIKKYTFYYSKLVSNNAVPEDLNDLLSSKPNNASVFLTPSVSKDQYFNSTFTFNSSKDDRVLVKIKKRQNFILRENDNIALNQKSELGQGIVAPQDFLNKKNAQKLGSGFNSGDGIFVLTGQEVKSIDFTTSEKSLIKPYFTTTQLHKYYATPKNDYWLIYTKSNVGRLDKKTKKAPIDSLPNIKSHLDRYKNVITSSFGPYGLHRAREQHFFEGEKIMALRKCSAGPIFTFVDFDCYVSQSFFIIQTNRINLKYLLGLLNSELVAFWLKHKGKMQGNNYQLDKEPLLEIPIYNPENISDTNNVLKLVEEILEQKKLGNDTTNIEFQINQLVYKLYDLTPEEIKIVEGA